MQPYPAVLSFLISWKIKLPHVLANGQVIAMVVVNEIYMEMMFITARPSIKLPKQ